MYPGIPPLKFESARAKALRFQIRSLWIGRIWAVIFIPIPLPQISSTDILLHSIVLQLSSTSCLGHGHWYDYQHLIPRAKSSEYDLPNSVHSGNTHDDNDNGSSDSHNSSNDNDKSNNYDDTNDNGNHSNDDYSSNDKD